MRRLLPILLLGFLVGGASFAQASANSGWVNSQEGCWCGFQNGLVRPYNVVGKYSTQADRQAGGDMISEWNRYATMFTVQVSPTEGLGAPGNGVNELNILINSTESQSIYGFAMDGNLYGRAVSEPGGAFGSFNECKDFSPSGCAAFTQTDVVVNQGFASGWTGDWYSDGGGANPALIQTTVVHEVGHTLGLHHIFSLPAFGDSFSTMNYANDDSMKWVTRMDAKTLRQEYSARVNSFTDVAIYPFTYGNAQYAETYASLSSTSVAPGGSVNLQNWLVQNVGTAAASNVVVTFYIWPAGSRQYPQPTDKAVGTATFATVVADSEADQASTPLTIPQDVTAGQYNVGAIVTVNGAEDTAFIAGKPPGNNRFILGHATRTVLTVGGGGGNCEGTSLSNGVPINGTVGAFGTDWYCLVVPSGATNLTIATTNATGDVDLYVRFGAPPTSTEWDCRPYELDGNEACSDAAPPAGTYFIAVDNIWGVPYSYTLTASYTGGATCSLSCTASAAPTSGAAPLNVSFTATATGTNCTGSPSYSWNFGDGGTSTTQNPSHTYVAAGTFNWTLTASQGGQTCSKGGSVTVTGATCSLTCTATVPTSGTAGAVVSFSSTAAPSNCAGGPTFSWNFGDGATSTTQNPSHTYAAAGTYSWSLTVTVDGQTCSKSGSITVSGGGNPSTLAIGTATGAAGSGVCVNVTLTNSGTPAITAFTTDITYDASKLTPTGVTTPVGGKLIGGNIVTAGTYRITLYGGTGTLPNGTVASVCFGTTSGACATYTLAHALGTPTASDAAANPVPVTGTSGSITTTGCGTCSVTCTASAAPNSGSAPLAVTFAATATPSNCTGSPTYAWTFGDGATSAQQNPNHTYSTAGTFSWTLTVSVGGQTCSKGGSITVTGGGGGRTFAIGTKSGAAGSNLCADITLSNGGAAAVITAFTTDITYDSTKLTPTGVTTPVGGKLIGGNVVTAGTYRITLYGGTGTLSDGTVANVCFNTTTGQCSTYALAHAAGSPTASDAGANAVTVTGTPGSIVTTGCGGGIPGDCDGNGTVSIGEVQKAINMFLGVQTVGCNADCNGNGAISIGEVQKVINAFLGLTTTC